MTATGEGQATHWGQFTRLAKVVINLVDGSVKGTVVFTAANGDQIFAETDGVPTGSPTTVGGTYTFTGGTGRFNGASGTAEFAGAFASDGIHISVDFEGTYSTERRTGQIPRKNKKSVCQAPWDGSVLKNLFQKISLSGRNPIQ